MTDVHDNPGEHRYEAVIDGRVAGVVVYALDGNRIVLEHTEVADAFEGRGVGSALARGVLDDVRARGLAVVPQCPFIREYIERHPEYGDLVAA